jgi:hypothetical protein
MKKPVPEILINFLKKAVVECFFGDRKVQILSVPVLSVPYTKINPEPMKSSIWLDIHLISSNVTTEPMGTDWNRLEPIKKEFKPKQHKTGNKSKFLTQQKRRSK